MKYLNQNIIFALLKQSGTATLNIGSFVTLNKLTSIRFRPAVQHCLSYAGFFIELILRYVKTTFRYKQWLPLPVIREAIANNWLDTLIYFIKIRSQYKKPVIYGYTTRKVGALIQASPTTVAHHVNILISKGLCERHGADLRLKSNHRLRMDYGFIVPVAISDNKQIQRNLLRFATIRRNLHTQYSKYTQKNNVLQLLVGNLKGYRAVRAAKSAAKKYDVKTLESSLQHDMTLSNRSFGRLCNRSASTGLKIQAELNKMRLIKSTKRVELVSLLKTNRKLFFAAEYTSDHFLTNAGQVFKRLSNGITLRKQLVVYR